MSMFQVVFKVMFLEKGDYRLKLMVYLGYKQKDLSIFRYERIFVWRHINMIKDYLHIKRDIGKMIMEM